MALSRYKNDTAIRGGKILQSGTAVMRIREAVKQGQLTLKVVILKESQRLDILAGSVYGDGRLWWIVAAASNIGWSMQVPPGTRLNVPVDLGQVEGII